MKIASKDPSQEKPGLMMPWIIMAIIGMVIAVLNVIQYGGMIIYALPYIGGVCLQVYFFIVVWSYRFWNILWYWQRYQKPEHKIVFSSGSSSWARRKIWNTTQKKIIVSAFMKRLIYKVYLRIIMWEIIKAKMIGGHKRFSFQICFGVIVRCLMDVIAFPTITSRCVSDSSRSDGWLEAWFFLKINRDLDRPIKSPFCICLPEKNTFKWPKVIFLGFGRVGCHNVRDKAQFSANCDISKTSLQIINSILNNPTLPRHRKNHIRNHFRLKRNL